MEANSGKTREDVTKYAQECCEDINSLNEKDGRAILNVKIYVGDASCEDVGEILSNAAQQIKKTYGDKYNCFIFPVYDYADAGAYFPYEDDKVGVVVDLNTKIASKPVNEKNALVLKSIDVDYDYETDQYIYKTGVSMNFPPEVIGIIVTPNNETFYYKGGEEIVVKIKNSIPHEIREMWEEWQYMKSGALSVNMDRSSNVGETVDAMKSNLHAPFKPSKPLDLLPYNIGDEIGRLYVLKTCKIYTSYNDTYESKDN